MQKAIDLIQAERYRQQDEHAYTPDHDDTHDNGELAVAAVCYAYPGHWLYALEIRKEEWPFNPDSFKPSPENRIRELVKAGALIVAEIERLQRL